MSTFRKVTPKYKATQKDILGTGFSVLERNAEKASSGNHSVKVRLVYDFDLDGAVAAASVATAMKAQGDSDAFVLPINAQVIRTDLRVLTTFTSATDAAVLSISIPTDDVSGLVAGAAISAGGNVWDATTKRIAGIQVGTVATDSEVTTAERNIEILNTHATEATTAGKVYVDIEYVELD